MVVMTMPMHEDDPVDLGVGGPAEEEQADGNEEGDDEGGN